MRPELRAVKAASMCCPFQRLWTRLPFLILLRPITGFEVMRVTLHSWGLRGSKKLQNCSWA